MSNDNDNFNPFDGDKTVIIPTPGGAPPKQANTTTPPAHTSTSAMSTNLSLPKISPSIEAEDNFVLGNCISIISYAAQLRQLHETPDVATLFAEMVHEIKQIGENLRLAGKTDDIIISSRYLVCSFVDEMILNTPWGSTSNWSTQSLLSYFHKESQGGTKFFEILKKLEQQSARYIELIELAYVCLSYGYLGMYRMQADGVSKIAAIKENLYRQVVQFKHSSPKPLARVNQGVDTDDNIVSKGKALLVTAAISCLALISLFVTLLISINESSDPVAKQAWELHSKLPTMIEKSRQVDQGKDFSALFATLSGDISSGKLEISNINGGYKFILNGDGLFASGSAQITNKPLVNRVAEVINQIEGPLKVVGHSDNIPIRTVQFPSNMHLSKKRAESIASAIGTSSSFRSIMVEGMADLEPIVPNNNASNRAINRRVEILLFSN